MSPTPDRERWRRLSDILDGALELPPQSRPSYLDQACLGDPGLRREAEELLAAEASGSFLDTPALERAAPLVAEMTRDFEASSDPFVGRLLGAYRLLSLLGEGG